MQIKVNTEINDQLNQPFPEEEIVTALNQMHSTKTPGLDGLPTVFFQKYWKSVSKGILTTCLHILNERGNIAPLNHTYIAIIPKIAKPMRVINYRLISL